MEPGANVLVTAMGGAFAREQHVRLIVTAAGGHALPFQVRQIVDETIGPLRTTLRLDGVVGAPRAPALNVRARITFFAGRRSVRVEVTMHNPRPAQHSGGYWELGDPGSVLLEDASLELVGAVGDRLMCSEHPDAGAIDTVAPLAVFQASSGGEHWQSRVHVNRDGVVPFSVRGYTLQAPGLERRGLRATPALWRNAEDGGAAIAVQHFWQNFPKTLIGETDRLVVGLFPKQAGDPHELQGGEQKTHVVGVAFARDEVSMRSLDWIVRPALASASPAWHEQASAIPYVAPISDPASPYETLVRGAIEGPDAFSRKREIIDEYGWRNFGDIYADHEAAFASPGPPLISHYNNQYDAVNGFAIQFLRSGDMRWWTAMDELARHVVDIDIYHTVEDKSAYSGGLFWHTYHYKDAGRATHRCYPRAEGIEGGGSSNEHNYSTGLMHYHLMTGHAWARDAVIGLADWVLRMDDGRLTPFRWLSRAPTGLASATASTAYHGPGRGAGNSIVALLNAFRLTRSRAYLGYAESLIRRCIHPADDIEQRTLLDAERKWSYTVFLQALARYLDDKAILGELDDSYTYAKASLLAYAEWMAAHEYPYLERPEILEYPTETWAAQDMRKGEVFLHASRYAGGPERARFLERAEHFFHASLDWLHRFETRTRVRPVVLLLFCGFMHEWARSGRPLLPASPGPAGDGFGAPLVFLPQKTVAIRRARYVALAGAGLAIALAVWFAMSMVP
jgi:hypothetical protein